MKRIIVTLFVLIAVVLLFPPGKERGGGLSRNGAAVIRDLQIIHAAETEYFAQFGKHVTLAQSGPAAGGTPGPKGADVLPVQLSSGKKDG